MEHSNSPLVIIWCFLILNELLLKFVWVVFIQEISKILNWGYLAECTFFKGELTNPLWVSDLLQNNMALMDFYLVADCLQRILPLHLHKTHLARISQLEDHKKIIYTWFSYDFYPILSPPHTLAPLSDFRLSLSLQRLIFFSSIFNFRQI